jgi:hypothetical protein
VQKLPACASTLGKPMILIVFAYEFFGGFMIGVPCDLTSIDCAKKIVTSSALDSDVKFQNCVVRGQAGIDAKQG